LVAAAGGATMPPERGTLLKRANRAHRFFAECVDGATVALPPGEAHHARHVLRLGAGAPVEVFDGRGNVAEGTVQPLARRGEAEVRVRARRSERPPLPRLHLGFAVPKVRRLDWLLEKATELGVGGLWPVVFERSVVVPRFTPHTRDRWRGICVAAAKQCGSNFLPELHPPRRLGEFLEACRGGVRLVGEAGAETTVAAAVEGWDGGEGIWLLVGPEGGLTDDERRAAREAGFRAVRVGDSVLRIETAAIALLAVVKALVRAG